MVTSSTLLQLTQALLFLARGPQSHLENSCLLLDELPQTLAHQILNERECKSHANLWHQLLQFPDVLQPLGVYYRAS